MTGPFSPIMNKVRGLSVLSNTVFVWNTAQIAKSSELELDVEGGSSLRASSTATSFDEIAEDDLPAHDLASRCDGSSAERIVRRACS